MPLIKRGIEPVNLSRTHVAPGVQNELECVTNNTLANVIRQLSSLSKHAEDMFSELYRDTNSFFHRANQLQERVDRLKVKVTQLDSTVEEVSLQDINMRKPFKSSVLKDQQIVTLMTRPMAIEDTYQMCDAPPALDKLNPYREDGKDSMKFYTDPQYFFELWCMEMQKDTELTKKELKKKKGKRGPNKKATPNVRQIQSNVQKLQRIKHGPEFAPEEHTHHREIKQDHFEHSRSPSRPNSLEIQNMEHLQQGGPYNNHMGGYPPEQYPYTGEQNNYHRANGPVMRSSSREEPVPQYQPPPPYSQSQQPPPYNATEYQTGPYNGNYQDGVPLGGSPQQTPTRRGGTPSHRAPSMVSSPARPTAAPPPPPPGADPYNRSASASRESLPPPPPPPPMEEVHNTPPYGSPQTPHLGNLRNDSPLRNTPSPASFTKSSTPDSIDLPPPPPLPPMMNTPDSMDSMPPPPPTPPPPEPLDHGGPPHQRPGPGAPPPPPPPPPSLAPAKDAFKKNIPNGNVPQIGDNASLASNGSSATVSSGSVKSEAVDGAPVRDNRSDLLHAIRTGFQLRKVEERRQKQEDKRPTGRLDVQSIMEAAFEMRRKALEANDSEDSDESEENEAWDSDE